MDTIEQEKLELLRNAIPKALAVRDALSSLLESPIKENTQRSQWPAFKSSVSESKLYSKSPIEDIVEGIQQQQPQAQCALGLYVKDGGVWIQAGTVAGFTPSEWGGSNIDGKIISSSGSGDVWAEININETSGEIINVAVAGGGSTPSSTSTSFYYILGYFIYNQGIPTISNYGCGSLDVTVCRNWFATSAPFYGVTFARGGTTFYT